MAGQGPKKPLDDSEWKEVWILNTYAVFMGYLSMAIKGLGFLVLTWTTVVLLGGFVSMLHKKDFWCLTFITLVQTAGIFDVVLNEKLSYMDNSTAGSWAVIVWGLLGKKKHSRASNIARVVLVCVLIVVQTLVFVALLCPLAIVYILGILISGGISLWRLIELDYKDVDAPNLEPAMETLYYLALLQGVLFSYRFILGRSEKRLVEQVTTDNCDDSELHVVYSYLQETRIGCEKDPSFAKGRNLITQGVDMISSSSPADCILGVKILYTALRIVDKQLVKVRGGRVLWEGEDYLEQKDIVGETVEMIKHLAVSASSRGHVLQKLLEALGSRGHDGETRKQAAAVVYRIAYSIKLERFPQGIEHISSLIDTFEQYYSATASYRTYKEEEQARCQLRSPAGNLGNAYKELLLQGMSILQRLADNEKNCRVMSETQGLVSKIMAPVTSDLLDHTTDDHGAWYDIVQSSMGVILELLTCAPGEAGVRLRHEISSCQGAVSTLWRILYCNGCNANLKENAIGILTQLYIHTESSISAGIVEKKDSSSREDFVAMLVDIFTHENKYSRDINKAAGMALSVLCSGGGLADATIVIQTSGGDIVHSLTKVLVHDEDESRRQKAAEILENLCTHYTTDDEYLGKLKKAMSDVVPEVLGKILRCGDKTHNGKEAFADIENQCDNGQERRISAASSSALQNDEWDDESSSSALQNDEWDDDNGEMLSSMLYLCGTVYDTFISEFSPDLAPEFDACSFLNKLKEMVAKKCDLPTLENLLLFKATTKMAISMMKHGGRIVKREDLDSLIEELSGASKNMLDFDHSMVFLSADSMFQTTLTSKIHTHTLASLVKEAQELHAMMPSTYVSG